MEQVEPSHEEGEEDREVIFREDDLQPVETTPPTPITSNDMDVIIRGWEITFEQISRCIREVQLASEKANADMFDISREGRARAGTSRSGAERQCTWVSRSSCRNVNAPRQRSHGEHAVHAVDAHRDTSQTASGI